MVADFRSDTITRPNPEMLEAMRSAIVGDDVFEEDPTVNALQEMAAEMFGMEAGLFVPSGTMGNQIAIRLLTRPRDQVICDKTAHIYLYEGGGAAANSLVSMRLISGERGRISAAEVEENINSDDLHFPRTSLVSIENTSNKGGGSIYPLDQIAAISEVCKQNSLSFHLDGARIFNALAVQRADASVLGNYFDTITFCLSKGLGAPVGSVLLSSAEKIKEARRIRKVFGGGMRQSGFLAAAGIYALKYNLGRLGDDHRRARLLGDALREQSWVTHVVPVDTNIVIFDIDPAWMSGNTLVQKLEESGIRSLTVAKNSIRLVTHLDISEEMLDHSISVIHKMV